MLIVINRTQLPMKYLDFKDISIIDFFAKATWELHDGYNSMVRNDA